MSTRYLVTIKNEGNFFMNDPDGGVFDELFEGAKGFIRVYRTTDSKEEDPVYYPVKSILRMRGVDVTTS